MSETPQAKKIRLTVNELAAAVQDRDAKIADLEARLADNQTVIDASDDLTAAYMAGAMAKRDDTQALVAAAYEAAAQVADTLFYPDETKISATIRDAIRAPRETIVKIIPAGKEGRDG